MTQEEFKYISTGAIDLEDRKAVIELLPEGEWLHPAAPKGKLVVTEDLLDEFISNFKERIVGPELPIDFRHEGETGTGIPFVGGWIVDMVKKIDELGRKAIYAVMHITDSEVAKRIKEKSLKYISPSIAMGFTRPEDGKLYNIIRAASLTNWPYIKNMTPVAPLNFEEIRSIEEPQRKEQPKGGDHNMSERFKELEAKQVLTFEEFEEYRTLLNDDTELDAQEVAFKLKEAFAKRIEPEKPEQKKIEPDKKDDKGGDIHMTEELKTKIEDLQKQIELAEKQRAEYAAQTFALQEKMREKDIQNEVSQLVASGRMTPAMGSIASKIMFSGETVKSKVVINLSDGKQEEQDTNIRALFAQFVDSMPQEWRIDFSTHAKKGVVVDEKLTLTEGSISEMSKEEYEARRAELMKKAAPTRALSTPEE